MTSETPIRDRESVETGRRTLVLAKRGSLRRASGSAAHLGGTALAVAALVGVAILTPALADAVWLKTFNAAVISAIAALGAATLYGRLGLASLCQVAFLGLGGWVALRLGYATELPFPLILLASGAATCIAGFLVGLPALRLSGVYFALITLMAAAAAEVLFQATQFPDGGSGFLGIATEGGQRTGMRRPAIAVSDPAYFRYTLGVAAICFLVVLVLQRSRIGRIWATIRQSEPTAKSVGINVTAHKLGAFALASGLTGVGGGLLAASVGSLEVSLFRASESVVLFAVVLVGGAYSLFGVLIAAAFMDLLPRLFVTIGIARDLVLVIFGLGVMQVLATQPTGIAGQLAAAVRRVQPRHGRGAER